jgi:hypothetical protein
MENSILRLYKSKMTIFSMKNLATLWEIQNRNTLKSKANFLAKTGKLRRLRYGLYSLNENYEKFELAGKIKNPSYVSLETVFRREGIIFQYSEEVTSISNMTKNYEVNGNTYSYRKIKDVALLDRKGIIFFDNWAIASKERAFLDMLYINPKYYFDNLRSINWTRCFELVRLYKNKNLVKILGEYKKIYQETYVE